MCASQMSRKDFAILKSAKLLSKQIVTLVTLPERNHSEKNHNVYFEALFVVAISKRF